MKVPPQLAPFGSAPQLKIDKKKHIFTGDEAKVSKVTLSRPFFGKNVLVERKMEINKNQNPVLSPKVFFFYESGNLPRTVALSNSIHGQLLHYYSLKLAAALFESNFPKMRAVRFSCKGSRIFSSIYSDFVPDENAVIPRKAKAMKKYYSLDESRRQQFKLMHEANEIKLCNKLLPSLVEISNAGFVLSYPLTNYHFAKGNCVFFEVDGIILDKLILHLDLLPQTSLQVKRRACAYLALVLATAIHAQVSNFVSLYGVKRLEEEGENLVFFYNNYFDNFASFARLMVRLATDKKFAVGGRPFLLFELGYAKNAIPFDFLKYNLNFFHIFLLESKKKQF
ncbi:MAG: hypothetical protein QXT25_01945 [Candidatus Anstonellaceae archaeon]